MSDERTPRGSSPDDTAKGQRAANAESKKPRATEAAEAASRVESAGEGKPPTEAQPSSSRPDEEEMEARRRRPRREQVEPEDEEEGREGFWDRAIGKRLEGLVPDVVKRTLVGSLGSLFMSEDGLKQSLTDLRLPKEVVTFIVQQADNTKREFMKLVAREMRDFLETTNFYDELRKILTGLSFEIRTEVRLIPNDNAFVKPDITNTVRVKRDVPSAEPQEDGER